MIWPKSADNTRFMASILEHQGGRWSELQTILDSAAARYDGGGGGDNKNY